MSDLDAVLAELDQRAAGDPRLERYRVRGASDPLSSLPSGWHVSGAIEQIATDGGWWPGEWNFPTIGHDSVGSWLTLRSSSDQWLHPVRWIQVGHVWERDEFFTPMMRQPRESAPMLGLSGQALWGSLAFPSEAALLEAFLITFDEMGFDEELEEVNPFFVEWVTDEPLHDVDEDPDGARRAHRRIQERSAVWKSTHPCWNPEVMPILIEGEWPPAAIEAALGLGQPESV